MRNKELRKRKNWQTEGGGKAGIAEQKFFDIFTKAFDGTIYKIRSKPKEFKDIYSKVELNEETLAL
ncbi:MAG: MunI family type II restriction endonuclease [Aridibacter sp.]